METCLRILVVWVARLRFVLHPLCVCVRVCVCVCMCVCVRVRVCDFCGHIILTGVCVCNQAV